jgi:hypothetical protein
LLSTRLAKAKLMAFGDETFVPRVRVLGFIPLDAALVGLDGVELKFTFDDERRYITVAANGGPSQAVAASFRTEELNPRWQLRFGTYRPADANGGLLSEVTLEPEEKLGILMGRAHTSEGQDLSLALELLSDAQAAIAGIGRYAGELIEFVSDDEFVFEGARFKRI